MKGMEFPLALVIVGIVFYAGAALYLKVTGKTWRVEDPKAKPTKVNNPSPTRSGSTPLVPESLLNDLDAMINISAREEYIPRIETSPRGVRGAWIKREKVIDDDGGDTDDERDETL